MHGFSTLDFCHQTGLASSFQHQLARQVHVIGVTRERHCQVVSLHDRSRLDVFAIFFGEGRSGEATTFAVDPLVVRQRATHHNGADQ
ncbi:hypothetical protein D3C76_1528340 [compost metagenome]